MMPLPVGIPSTDPLSVENADLAGSEFAYMGHKKIPRRMPWRISAAIRMLQMARALATIMVVVTARLQARGSGRTSLGSQVPLFQTNITESPGNPLEIGSMPGLFRKLLGRALSMDGGLDALKSAKSDRIQANSAEVQEMLGTVSGVYRARQSRSEKATNTRRNQVPNFTLRPGVCDRRAFQLGPIGRLEFRHNKKTIP